MSKVFVVEDEASIRELVYYALKSDGHTVEGFESAPPFWKRLQSEKPGLILLDIMLPGENGFEILRGLKKAKDTAHIPVIMLTAIHDEDKRVEGLDSGADDYVTKPFSVSELLARVRAVLRRASGSQKEGIQLSLGELSVNVETRIATAQGQEVELTFLEFELLYCLLRHKDIAMSRDQLLDLVWKAGEDGGPADRNVDMQVRSLRKKLGTCGDMIKTIRGVGYKIN